MSGHPHNEMPLPAAALLLSHHPGGGAFVANVAKEIAVAGAEIGELIRLNLLTVHGDRLYVLAPGPTGVYWADSVLVPLAQRNRPMKVRTWLVRRARDGAFDVHRRELVAHRLITVHRRRRMGIFPYDSFTPDVSAQAAVLNRLRRVLRGEQPVDPWVAQLAATVYGSGIGARWLHERRERKALESLASGQVLGVELARVVAASSGAAVAAAAGATAAM